VGLAEPLPSEQDWREMVRANRRVLGRLEEAFRTGAAELARSVGVEAGARRSATGDG
jgi:hypothetical protein